MKCSIYKDLVLEIMMVILFVTGAIMLKPATMFVVYAAVYIAYLLLNKKKVIELFQR